MLDLSVKEKLKEPGYLELHLAAVAAIARVGKAPWYDAHFVRRFEAAKLYLDDVAPEKVREFVGGFTPLEPRDGFEVIALEGLFDQATQQRIVETLRSIPPASQDSHEKQEFGRTIVHDHPYFVELQTQLLPLVSNAVGIEVAAGYNFLSLYGGTGRCGLHMDEPISMYTLDYCIEQSAVWPIHISRPVRSAEMASFNAWSPEAIKADETYAFEPHILRPNDAIIFNGSSQWHYRDQIPAGHFCNLLFFHFFPAGLEELVAPSKWASHFGIDELVPLCDLFVQAGVDGFG